MDSGEKRLKIPIDEYQSYVREVQAEHQTVELDEGQSHGSSVLKSKDTNSVN